MATATDEHTRYLGALGLLCECSVYVPEDIRQMIEIALEDACRANPNLQYRRILDGLEIDARREQRDEQTERQVRKAKKGTDAGH